LAEKQYISPVRLFEQLGIDYQDNINIARIKKHLTAEFNLAKDGLIEIDGHAYSRNDVMNEIDREDFAARMVLHQKLWKNHFLLTMLETNEANLPEVRTALNGFQNNIAFDEFFSPWFAGPFNAATRVCINNNNLADLGEWLTMEAFILPAKREEAFRATRIFLDESLKLFNNINKENYSTFKPKLTPWLRYGWYKFLNNLPDELFQYREEIAVDLINLTVQIQKNNKQDCRDISNNLVQVKGLSENLQDTVLNNDKVYNQTGVSSSGNYWWVLWVAIVFFRILSGGCG
jgi:hypothetical protein